LEKFDKLGGIFDWEIGLKWNADDADDADFIFSLLRWTNRESGRIEGLRK
jgi:hypothetical protein